MDRKKRVSSSINNSKQIKNVLFSICIHVIDFSKVISDLHTRMLNLNVVGQDSFI